MGAGRSHNLSNCRPLVTEMGAEMIPHTSSLSALSLLRPPRRHDGPAFSSYREQGDKESGLDALERLLVDQVGLLQICVLSWILAPFRPYHAALFGEANLPVCPLLAVARAPHGHS